jgi:hypothetical protein
MTDADRAIPAAQDRSELALRWYQARLGFWQALWGTLVTGGLAVAIPAGVDTYKVIQERRVKELEIKLKERELALKDKELEGTRLAADQQYISKFVDAATNPDVEARIRFSQYFSFVSSGPYREGWERFFTAVESRRDKIRSEINQKESQIDKLRAKDDSLDIDEQSLLTRLQRELAWSYSELGYANKVLETR